MFLAKDIRFEVLRLLKFLKVLVYKEDKTHITSYDPASMTLSLSHRFYSAVLAMIDSVRPSDRLSQSGITPKRLQIRACGLHWRIAP